MKKILTSLVLGASLLFPSQSNADTYTRDLNQGWNLISIPYELGQMSVPEVFSSVGDDLIEVKDDIKVWNNNLPEQVRMKSMFPEKGYWVDVAKSSTLTIDDLTKAQRDSIHLKQGWNLIGYLYDTPKTPELFFGNCLDKIVAVNGFENGALTYDPLLPEFSDLKEMKPNYGYWVNAKSSFDLAIPEPNSAILLATGLSSIALGYKLFRRK